MRRWFFLLGGLVALGMPAEAQTPALLIFGGDDHKVFLGCLNCAATDSNSVWNDYSTYGWNNKFGTWNRFGEYANKFASQSACNEFTSDAPVIVDRSGNSYGSLTLNKFAPGSICGVSGDEKLCTALKVMCADD
jgi:hypothetical protein